MKKKLVIFTGAGISKESGIPTFRDGADGLWNNVPVELVCTPRGLAERPDIVHEFYNELRDEMLTKEPNSAHYDCVELEKYFDVTVVTQNVDNLHEKAGSNRVIKIHGDLTKVRSTGNSKKVWTYLGHTDPDMKIEGHRVRPHIVFFYEDLLDWNEARKACREADMMIVVGTSLQVYPAASLLNDVQFGNTIYYIDPNPGQVPELCVSDVVEIKKTATEGMKEVMHKILTYVEDEKDWGTLMTLEEYEEAKKTWISTDDSVYYSDGIVVFNDMEVDSSTPDDRCTHVMWYGK